MLGGTLDDALGEAFDKAARLLGLQYNTSGGAAVEAMARKHAINNNNRSLEGEMTHNMTVPMRDKANCDFSYAGKTNSSAKVFSKALH